MGRYTLNRLACSILYLQGYSQKISEQVSYMGYSQQGRVQEMLYICMLNEIVGY